MTTLTREHVAREPITWSWWSGPCRALDHDFEVLLEPEVAADVAPLLEPFRVRCQHPKGLGSTVRYEVRHGPGPGRMSVYADDERLASGRWAVDLLGSLAWHINQSVIEQSVDRHVLLHAAAASLARVTVVLAADMESGKTTTVAGLLRNGFDYITDEAVAVDPLSGGVTPFPKTLSLDRGSWPLFAECRPADTDAARTQWHVAPHQLGARTVESRTGRPRVVLFPKYVPGAVTEVVPVSKAEAVHELARMTFRFELHPRRNLEVAARLVSDATVARLRIGTLEGAVRAVEELVSQRILEDL